MNIIFFGSSQFAVPSLEALLANEFNIACVVTQPDRAKGRGLHLASTAIKDLAEKSRLEIYQPQNINTEESASFLKKLGPDIFVIISYGQILSTEIIDIPRILPINVHASLLPKYRGAAPVNRALINGDKETGVTVIKITKEMDAGPIILQKCISISSTDNALTLEQKLADSGAFLLIEALHSIVDGSYKLTEQDGKAVSFAKKLQKEDGRIDWKKPAEDIYNLIRGCIPWPGAFTYYKDKLLKVFAVEIGPTTHSPSVTCPGQILDFSKEGITVATGERTLVIKELQIEGKRKMSAEEFIAGHKIAQNEFFGKK